MKVGFNCWLICPEQRGIFLFSLSLFLVIMWKPFSFDERQREGVNCFFSRPLSILLALPFVRVWLVIFCSAGIFIAIVKVLGMNSYCVLRYFMLCYVFVMFMLLCYAIYVMFLLCLLCYVMLCYVCYFTLCFFMLILFYVMFLHFNVRCCLFSYAACHGFATFYGKFIGSLVGFFSSYPVLLFSDLAILLNVSFVRILFFYIFQCDDFCGHCVKVIDMSSFF